MSEELKPCPFCGCAADGPFYGSHIRAEFGYEDTYSPHYRIRCSNAACDVVMELPGPEIMVIVAWNTRQEQPK